MEKGRGLAGRDQAIVLEHVERKGPVLVGMKNHPAAGDAVNGRVNALRGQFDQPLALEGLARLVEHDEIAGTSLRPVQTEGQHQVAIVVAGHGHGKVIIDTLFEFVVDREAQRSREVDFRLGSCVGVLLKCVNAHALAPFGVRS